MTISNKYQKDYSSADFKNPRILKKKEARILYLKRFFICVVIFVVLAFVYSLFFSPFFQIKRWQVLGLDKIRQENIDKIVEHNLNKKFFLVFGRDNYWLFSKNILKKDMERYYRFEDLEIKKQWRGSLVIKITEKKPLANWTTGVNCFQLDYAGTAIGYCENSEVAFNLRDLLSRPMEIGQIAIDQGYLEYINGLHYLAINTLKEKYLPLYYELAGNLLTVYQEEGPVLYFNSDLSAEEQVFRLRVVLSDKELSGSYLNLRYVDLRFGEKVYFR